jgi:DivIVA domain-containing protein
VIVFLVLIVVLMIGLTTAAVMGKISGFMAEPTSTHSFPGLPSGPLASDDVSALRFDQGLRGYRMDQVDEVIVAMTARLRELETEVASSRSRESL